MALFFDQDWFRTKLDEAGKTPEALARAAGLTLEDLAAVWKDQLEVTAGMVAAFARVLGEDPGEVASRCGISTPGHGGGLAPQTEGGLDEAVARIAALEREVAGLRSEIIALRLATEKNGQETP